MIELNGVKTALWPERVRIMDVGPRDGLQNEPYRLATDKKTALIAGLVHAGVRWIEATSFVHPKAVPQMADAAEVAAALPSGMGVTYYALIPNEKGYERALAAGLDHVGLVLSVTETMNQKNINMSVAESLAVAEKVIARAKGDGVKVRVYVSVAFVCPFEGVVDGARTLELTGKLLAMGTEQVCIADTIGRAHPGQVAALFSDLRERHGGGVEAMAPFAAHFHNTYGMAIANTLAALQQGVSFFDASIGGLGGCPFAPGATGNTPTEDLVHLFHRMGVETGIDLEKLTDLSDMVRGFSGSLPPSAYYRATRVKQKAS